MSSTEGADAALTEIELQILKGLERLGGGYQQRNLWKYIGIDSKTGLAILARLEKRGFITREKVGSGRRGVYVVKLTEKAYRLLSKLCERPQEPATADFSPLPGGLRVLLSVPCTYCPYSDRCGISFISPVNCELLTKWSRHLS
jgi:DNA-binding MarR family transcriptional regulator